MELEEVGRILRPYLEERGLILVDISWASEENMKILRVLIDRENGISIDTLAECNEFLSSQLDRIDQDMDEYFLEVSSPGAERPLNSLSEVGKQISKYVHIEVEGMIYEGILEAVENDILTVRFNAKGRFKVVKIPYDEIRSIRLAVKI